MVGDCIALFAFYYAWKAMSYKVLIIGMFFQAIAVIVLTVLIVNPYLINDYLLDDNDEPLPKKYFWAARLAMAAMNCLILFFMYKFYKAVMSFKADSEAPDTQPLMQKQESEN